VLEATGPLVGPDLASDAGRRLPLGWTGTERHLCGLIVASDVSDVFDDPRCVR